MSYVMCGLYTYYKAFVFVNKSDMLVARQNSKPHKPLHKLHLTNFTSQTSLHKPQKPHFASLCEKKCTFRPQPSKFFPEKISPIFS